MKRNLIVMGAIVLVGASLQAMHAEVDHPKVISQLEVRGNINDFFDRVHILPYTEDRVGTIEEAPGVTLNGIRMVASERPLAQNAFHYSLKTPVRINLDPLNPALEIIYGCAVDEHRKYFHADEIRALAGNNRLIINLEEHDPITIVPLNGK